MERSSRSTSAQRGTSLAGTQHAGALGGEMERWGDRWGGEHLCKSPCAPGGECLLQQVSDPNEQLFDERVRRNLAHALVLLVPALPRDGPLDVEG